jgi:Peptidase family M23
MRLAASTLFSLALTGLAQAESFELGLPVACEIGKTCWVQNYFDRDPSPTVKDYACGGQTYDGHDGTDIRVLNTGATADVIASAAGVVKGVRDGVADHLMRTEADRAAVGNRECGNGVVIDHADGWQTQYCHMRQGSVAVKTGDKVEAGAKLGEVGYSGMAAFPHVHLSVRRNDEKIDPFGDGACGAAGNPIWSAKALTALAYEKGEVIQSGFSPAPFEMADLETGKAPAQNPSGAWPAMVAYGWAINLANGDALSVTLRGPGGIAAENTVTLDRDKAVYMLFAGKKRPPGGWPKGEYVGSLTVSNAGQLRISKEWRATLE